MLVYLQRHAALNIWVLERYCSSILLRYLISTKSGGPAFYVVLMKIFNIETMTVDIRKLHIFPYWNAVCEIMEIKKRNLESLRRFTSVQ